MLLLRAATFDDPVARRLVFAQWSDMTVRYGGDPPCDEDAAIPHGSFVPPDGVFLVAERDGEPVGCVGIRRCEQATATAEMKRLYSVPEARGTGVGRFLVAAAEREAASLGYAALWLETGLAQPEAVRLYETSGYERIEPYGEYKDSPLSVCFAKRLVAIAPGAGGPAEREGTEGP